MPEPGGRCHGDLGLGKRQLLKGWPDLWLAAGDAPGLRARPMAAAAPPPTPEPDQTLALPDALLLRVLACLPEPHLTGAASLVCRRWTRLAGRLRRRLAVRDWGFVAHRLPYRFPDLADLDLFPASIAAPTAAARTSAWRCRFRACSSPARSRSHSARTTASTSAPGRHSSATDAAAAALPLVDAVAEESAIRVATATGAGE